MQDHFSYRDFHIVNTLPMVELQSLALFAQALAAGQVSTAAYYVFGTNAQARLNIFATPPAPYGVAAWPATCYARDILVRCTQDAWVSIVSLNPAYLRETYLKLYTKELQTAPMLIAEEEQFVLANAWIRLHPTYGYALIFRADAVAGTLLIWIEGNVEGGE